MTLYRSMREEADRLPTCEQSARGLGVRVRNPDAPPDADALFDIEVDGDGKVHAGTGGMSVALGHPSNLERHRRPAEFKGTGKDDVFAIAAEDVGSSLRHRPDPDKPKKHGYVEPASSMALAAYHNSLCASRERWRKVHADNYSGN